MLSIWVFDCLLWVDAHFDVFKFFFLLEKNNLV
jgi:hypothetical protein